VNSEVQAGKPLDEAPFVPPKKICALVALPRSGTTVITSTFAVHSQVVAVFEPWNATKNSEALKPTINEMARLAHKRDLGGKILFIKETGTRPIFVSNLRKLVEDAPETVEKHVLVVLRRPVQTFLSEVARRGEWWDDKVELGPETLKKWVNKSRTSLRSILHFAKDFNGLIISLGAFASHPKVVLEDLSRRVGFEVEDVQLEYEKHLDRKIVRGDKNVESNPTSIDIHKVDFRDADDEKVRNFNVEILDKKWIDAVDAFYDFVSKAGGVLQFSDIPEDMKSQLLGHL